MSSAILALRQLQRRCTHFIPWQLRLSSRFFRTLTSDRHRRGLNKYCGEETHMCLRMSEQPEPTFFQKKIIRFERHWIQIALICAHRSYWKLTGDRGSASNPLYGKLSSTRYHIVHPAVTVVKRIGNTKWFKRNKSRQSFKTHDLANNCSASCRKHSSLGHLTETLQVGGGGLTCSCHNGELVLYYLGTWWITVGCDHRRNWFVSWLVYLVGITQ